MAYIISAYYQPTTALAVLHLKPCFALVSCKTTEDILKWTCERLALILGTAPQHVPPEWLGARKFSFQPNPITMLCYGSWTTRIITRSKPDSNHSYRLYGLYVEKPVDTRQLERTRRNMWQLSTRATVGCTSCTNRRQSACHTSQHRPTHTARPHIQSQG